jgi:diguanylate cyclase (GGDEF)-like protein
MQDSTEHKQATEQSANVTRLLEHTARTDYLTGLDNRRSLDQALTKALSAARRHVHPLSLAMIDLDLFKKFNDEFGHQAGDGYLKEATSQWRSILRPEDFIARYGGEEFVVVLPETLLDGAIQSMERLRAATPAPLTCSVGLVQWNGVESADKLIGRADGALYQTKMRGRDRLISVPVPDNVRSLFSSPGSTKRVMLVS